MSNLSLEVSPVEKKAFLVEIGCEEIPARFLSAAERDLGERLENRLCAARLLDSGTPVKTGSTPRRLVAYVPSLPARQPDRVNTISGPPAKVAFDPEGKPTRAASAFAAKHHLQVSDLRRIQSEKGEYMAADIREAGRDALQVLVEALPQVIGSLSFPKSMYWTKKSGPFFVRPIRWILALLSDGDGLQVVPFEFAGVRSGSYTFGHRLRGSQPVEVHDLNHDLKLLDYWVEIHTARRRERVCSGIKALVEGKQVIVASDEFLEEWVVNSTEWPVPLMGSFDRRYLALPREVLVTVMRDHQKYFAVEDLRGALQPYFVTVLNVPGDPKGLIRQGHERVLTARFADAEFFWNADLKIPLVARIPMLERVMYQEKLGTYGDKVRRMKVLAEDIVDELEKRGKLGSEQRRHALRAVELCKCDLTTQMVQEFTELQGIMGGLYARTQGEPHEVADAIYDHYKPENVEDTCPRSMVGAVVSLVDKFDSVVAGFAAGLEPSGSSDPFALRRAGNGIIKLAIEALPPRFDFSEVFDGFLSAHQSVFGTSAARAPGGEGLRERVDGFLRERTEFYFREVAGLRYDTARAVLGSAALLRKADGPWGTWTEMATQLLKRNAPADALSRAKALERVRDTEDFLALAAAAKRTRNIRKSASEADLEAGEVDLEQFKEEAERKLYEAYQRLRDRIDKLRAVGHYEEAFRAMATIRPYVDRFFDKVLVMVEDAEVRRNRLRLLQRLNEEVFTSLADLAEIAVESRRTGIDA
jgi:glycyl-tRNA synthetase beta chain